MPIPGIPMPQAPELGIDMPGMLVIPDMSVLGRQPHDGSAPGMLMPGIPIGMPMPGIPMGGIPIGVPMTGIPMGGMDIPEPVSPLVCALAGNAAPSAIPTASAR